MRPISRAAASAESAPCAAFACLLVPQRARTVPGACTRPTEGSPGPSSRRHAATAHAHLHDERRLLLRMLLHSPLRLAQEQSVDRTERLHALGRRGARATPAKTHAELVGGSCLVNEQVLQLLSSGVEHGPARFDDHKRRAFDGSN